MTRMIDWLGKQLLCWLGAETKDLFNVVDHRILFLDMSCFMLAGQQERITLAGVLSIKQKIVLRFMTVIEFLKYYRVHGLVLFFLFFTSIISIACLTIRLPNIEMQSDPEGFSFIIARTKEGPFHLKSKLKIIILSHTFDINSCSRR